jgi:hypothetical protein
LGFALLGVSDRSACRGLHRDSSCVLNDSADGGHPSRTHLRVSITERLPQPVAGPRPLLGFLHLSASKHSSQREPGLCVHLTGGPPLLADPTGSWGSRGSTGAARRRTSVPGESFPIFGDLLNIRDRGPFVQTSALLMRRPGGLTESDPVSVK